MTIEEIKADLAKQEKRLVLYQLGIDQTSAISSLIAASEGNPLNALTSGAAGIAQLVAGLIKIGINFKLAQSKLKQYGEGGLISHGNSHSNGGTVIEAEKGEFVLRKNIVSQYGKEISLLNAGVPLENLTENNILLKNNNLDIQRNNYLRKLANKKDTYKSKIYKTLAKF